MSVTRQISGVLLTPDGNPVPNSSLTFTLVDLSGSPIPGFDADANEWIASSKTVNTDGSGAFTVALVPNDRITGDTYYQVSANARGYKTFKAKLLSGVGAVTFKEFYASGATLTPSAASDLAIHINDAAKHITTDQNDALDGANAPSAVNPVATMADVVAGAGHEIQDEGTPLTARAALNFKGAGVSVTDNPAAGSSDVTISTPPHAATHNPGGADPLTYEPANANIQNHIASTANPHNVTPAQVGAATAQWNADKIQGAAVSPTAPTDGQILKFVGANNQYEPVTSAGGQTDTVAGANGIQNTGNNVNASLSPVYGITANTICQGNDARLSDARTPVPHATAHVTGGSDVISSAVPSGASGLMTGADKAKLDGVEAGATNTPLATTTPAAQAPGDTGAIGVSTKAAKEDHKHPLTAFGTGAGSIAEGNHAHSGVYEPANANIQNHIASTANPHGVTKTQVGLGNVVDAAQVRTGTADTITAQHSFAPTVAQAPFALGANAQGQLVTGLNADKLDGSDASAFATSGHDHAATYAPIAKGVTNGDSHDHTGGDGAQIPLASGVTGTLPIANGGTGQATATAALNALLPSQTGKSGNVLMSGGSDSIWDSTARENILINDEFIYWQRGTSFTGASGVFTADRWYVLTTAGSTTFTVSRQSSSLAEGFNYSLRAQRNSGASWTDQLRVGQALVTLDSAQTANKSVTLSFWAKKGANYSANSSYLYSSFQEGRGNDQSTATSFTSPSGWTSPTTTSQANTLTTSWQKFSHTITVNALTTQLGIFFATIPGGTAGADDWFEITGVKLEIGSVATGFKHLPIQQGLALCQRYYEIIGGSATNDIAVTSYATAASEVNGQLPIMFKVPKRVIPTCTITGTWGVSNCGQPYVGGTSVFGTCLQALSIAAGRMFYYTTDTGDTITANAEL